MHEILLTLLILKENEVVRMNSYKAIKLALGSGGYFGFAISVCLRCLSEKVLK